MCAEMEKQQSVLQDHIVLIEGYVFRKSKFRDDIYYGRYATVYNDGIATKPTRNSPKFTKGYVLRP